MKDFVLWTGPVDFFQVRGATIPGAIEYNLQCLGDRDPNCTYLGNSLLDSSGRRLPSLLEKAHVVLSDVNDVFIGAFSAGGSVVWRLLVHPEDRKKIRAVLLSDATYTSKWVDEKNRVPEIFQSWIDYAIDCIDGDHLFVATASPNPNGRWASGIENIRELRRQLELKTQKKFEKLDHFYGISPGPDSAYKLGNVILAEFPSKPLGHYHTKIAGQVWKNILFPWLEKKQSDPEPGSWTDKDDLEDNWKDNGLLYFLISGSIGYILFNELRKYFKRKRK